MTTLQDSAQKQLRQLIEQIERLEEEKRALAADIRDKYLEAKGVGFDAKVMRTIVALRRKSKAERQETDSVLAVYMHALGMADDFEEASARFDMAGDADDWAKEPTAEVHPIRDYHPIARAREYPALGSSSAG